jgi:hypothetical protein
MTPSPPNQVGYHLFLSGRQLDKKIETNFTPSPAYGGANCGAKGQTPLEATPKKSRSVVLSISY